jgi:hypothetical protein
VELLPAPQGRLIVLRGIHVEKAQPFGIKTADLVFTDFTGRDLFVEIDWAQLAAFELILQKWHYTAPVDRKERLEPLQPEGHNDIVA